MTSSTQNEFIEYDRGVDMVTLTVLSPGPEPRKETAHHRPKNLQEQLMAFLNSNNSKGFAEDPQYKYEPPPLEYKENVKPIISMILEVAEKECLTSDAFKEYGREISKASGIRKIIGKRANKLAWEEGVTRRAIPITHAYNLVSRIFGYAHYREVQLATVTSEDNVNGIIHNKRKPGEFKAEFFPDL